MNNIISLEVQCPHCHASLMDRDVCIDNSHSIQMNIKVNDTGGFIRLSSIYGSYNFSTDIKIPENVVIDFYCPSCRTKLESDRTCNQCAAPMIPLRMSDKGRVCFCSRAGCKKHTIEFDDLSAALKQFYQDFDYGGKPRPVTDEHIHETARKIENEIEQKNEILKTGAYLHSFCPHCKKTIIQDNLLKFKVVRDNGESGFLMLSPYLNVFTHVSTILLPEQTVVNDIRCIHCDSSMIEKEKKCKRCGSPIAKISVAAVFKLIDFYICSKKGCTWHGLSDEDLSDIIIQDSEEW